MKLGGPLKGAVWAQKPFKGPRLRSGSRWKCFQWQEYFSKIKCFQLWVIIYLPSRQIDYFFAYLAPWYFIAYALPRLILFKLTFRSTTLNIGGGGDWNGGKPDEVRLKIPTTSTIANGVAGGGGHPDENRYGHYNFNVCPRLRALFLPFYHWSTKNKCRVSGHTLIGTETSRVSRGYRA